LPEPSTTAKNPSQTGDQKTQQAFNLSRLKLFCFVNTDYE